MDSTKEIVLLVVQHIIAQRHAWRHQFRDTTFHELLCELRVFQLVTDGHALASTYQLRQIGIEGMMRKSSHLVTFVVTIVTMSQRDTQDTGRRHSILTIGLIKVATTKQQHRIRVLCLQVKKLLHHRGQLPVFLCHLSFLFL